MIRHIPPPIQSGLTKREWFLGMILQGLAANHIMINHFDNNDMIKKANQIVDKVFSEQ